MQIYFSLIMVLIINSKRHSMKLRHPTKFLIIINITSEFQLQHYALFTMLTLTPSLGLAVTTVFIGISARSGWGSTNLKSLTSLLMIIFISSMAKFLPIQDRGPAMKGMYVNGWIFGASRPNLSGSNFMGSGHMSSRRCITSWEMIVYVPVKNCVIHIGDIWSQVYKINGH